MFALLLKIKDETSDWVVYHKDVGNQAAGALNSTAVFYTSNSTIWDSTTPTATSFRIGANANTNSNGKNYIAYIFSGGASTAATARSVSLNKAGNEHLSVAASSDFAFGTGDFTVEGWFNITESGTNSNAWDLRDAGDSNQFFLRCISGTSWDLRFAGSLLATFTAEVKVWNHIAVSRSGSTLKIFVNGVETNSISNSSDATNTGPLLISTFYDTTGSGTDYGFTGNVSNFRVVKGTAVYTSSFRPPTAPLSNITNTKLLCCNDSSTTGSTVTPGTIAAVGSPTASTDNPFYDSGLNLIF